MSTLAGTSISFVPKRKKSSRVVQTDLSLSFSFQSGIVFPFIIEALLRRFGSGPTLWGLGLVLFVLIGSLLPYIKGRLPDPPRTQEARREAPPQAFDYSFFTRRKFWILWLVSSPSFVVQSWIELIRLRRPNRRICFKLSVRAPLLSFSLLSVEADAVGGISQATSSRRCSSVCMQQRWMKETRRWGRSLSLPSTVRQRD